MLYIIGSSAGLPQCGLFRYEYGRFRTALRPSSSAWLTHPSLVVHSCLPYLYLNFPKTDPCPLRPSLPHSSRRRKGRRSARGIMIGRRWAFLKASIAEVGLSVRIVVPMAMKKLQTKRSAM